MFRISTVGSITPGTTAHDWTALFPKVTVGSAELEYPGGSVAATGKAITHGLGATPTFAAVMFTDAGNTPGVTTYTSTQFTAICQKRDGTSPAAGTKAPFRWMAVLAGG
jgi:hypothetical protein